MKANEKLLFRNLSAMAWAPKSGDHLEEIYKSSCRYTSWIYIH